MNICIDAREFVKGRKTGISRYLETFLPSILGQPACRATILTHDTHAIPDFIRRSNNVQLKTLSAPTVISDQFLIPKIMKEASAGIFFSPYYKVPLTGNFKRIITVHDIMFLRLPPPASISRLLAAIQIRLSTRKADVILTDSEYTRKDLSNYLSGIAGKIVVLRPTLCTEWLIPPDSTSIRDACTRYAANKPYFLYVGNFKQHKNVNLLVKAFMELEKGKGLSGHCLLLVGGDPKNTAQIEEMAGQAIQSGLIRIHNDVSDADLKSLYAGAQWFISASEFEGFGYPMLEAMASACPIICTSLTSIPEIAGDAAILIDRPDFDSVAKSIQNAISTKNETRILQGGKCLETARKFIDTNQPDAICSVLNRLAAS